MTIATSGSPENLAELEAHLSTVSHDDQALRIIQNFAQKLGKTSKRQSLFNSKGALIREPIIYQHVLNRGVTTPHTDTLRGTVWAS